MSDTKMLPVSSNFNMESLVQKLTETYQQKGFEVSVVKMGNGVSVTLSKDDGGVKKWLGLAKGLTANISLNSDKTTLAINFVDAEWIGKIVGFIVGFLCLLFPIATAAYGSIKQCDLPKQVAKDIQMLL